MAKLPSASMSCTLPVIRSQFIGCTCSNHFQNFWSALSFFLPSHQPCAWLLFSWSLYTYFVDITNAKTTSLCISLYLKSQLFASVSRKYCKQLSFRNQTYTLLTPHTSFSAQKVFSPSHTLKFTSSCRPPYLLEQLFNYLIKLISSKISPFVSTSTMGRNNSLSTTII